MKKKLLLCLFLTLPLLGNAQLLWEISGNHLKQKSYLFGSHHLVPISFLDSIKGIYPAFNSCENVVGEIILDDPSVIKKLQQAAVITTGKTGPTGKYRLSRLHTMPTQATYNTQTRATPTNIWSNRGLQIK